NHPKINPLFIFQLPSLFIIRIVSLDLPLGPGFCWINSISLSDNFETIATWPYGLKIVLSKTSKSFTFGLDLLGFLYCVKLRELFFCPSVNLVSKKSFACP